MLIFTALAATNTSTATAQLRHIEGLNYHQRLGDIGFNNFTHSFRDSVPTDNAYFNSDLGFYNNSLESYSPSIQTDNISSGGTRISRLQEVGTNLISLRQQTPVLTNLYHSDSIHNPLAVRSGPLTSTTQEYIVYSGGGIYYGKDLARGSVIYDSSFSSLISRLNANLSGGGIIFIKAGTYNVDTPISITHSIDIVGEGRGKTILLRTIPSSSPTLTVSGSNLTLSRLTVNGNYPTNTSSMFNELLLTGNNIRCTDIEVKNFNAIGISAHGAGITVSNSVITGVNTANKSTFGIWAANDKSTTIISRCNIQYTSLNAVFGGNIFTLENSYIANNAIAAGGQIGSAPNTVIATVINNIIGPGLGLDSGIEMAPTGKWIVANNRITGQNHWGIVTDGGLIIGPAIVKGNVVKNCKLSAIYINGAQRYFTIEDNTLFDDRYPPTQKYGIQIANAAADHYIIKNNIIYNNKFAEILDQGTGSDKQITGNTGYSPLVQSPMRIAASPLT